MTTEEALAEWERRNAADLARIAAAGEPRRAASPGTPTTGHRARLRAAQMRRQQRAAADDPETTRARCLRLEREWSQLDLASRALVARYSVIRFEQRTPVAPVTAKRIARALGVPVEKVYDEARGIAL